MIWSGTNQMSENRINCINQFKEKSESEFLLVNPDNIDCFIVPSHPLHKAYMYLSETHKADYLRFYLMYHHGGGYSDIKKTTGSWKQAFIDLENSAYDVCGYPSIGFHGIAHPPSAPFWKELIGPGAFIFKKGSILMKETLEDIEKRLDETYEELKLHPATSPTDVKGSGSGYPLHWAEICGAVFHKIVCKYKDRLLRTLPISIFSNYR